MNILIAEDLPSLREHAQQLIQKLLAGKAESLNIESAATGLEAVQKACAGKFDLIIMDIAMPDLNGIKAASEIWAKDPGSKILFWSQYHYEAYIRERLSRTKPFTAMC
jgi:DNA-binding NarL/FixJ family response regulator